jgi:dehydrogenase/reductase SDR family member 7B
VRTGLSVNALRGDGSTMGRMDKGQSIGMDPGVCSEKIVPAIEAERNEVYLGGKEIRGVYLKRFVPNLLARIIRRVPVR